MYTTYKFQGVLKDLTWVKEFHEYIANFIVHECKDERQTQIIQVRLRENDEANVFAIRELAPGDLCELEVMPWMQEVRTRNNHKFPNVLNWVCSVHLLERGNVNQEFSAPWERTDK